MTRIEQKANKAINIIKNAQHSSEPSKYFGRKFDDIFENGNGKEIVFKIVEIYQNDKELQSAVKKLDYWIGIDGWIETYNKETSKSLF